MTVYTHLTHAFHFMIHRLSMTKLSQYNLCSNWHGNNCRGWCDGHKRYLMGRTVMPVAGIQIYLYLFHRNHWCLHYHRLKMAIWSQGSISFLNWLHEIIIQARFKGTISSTLLWIHDNLTLPQGSQHLCIAWLHFNIAHRNKITSFLSGFAVSI